MTTCNSSTVAGYGDWRLPSVNDYRQLTGGTLVCSACPCPGPTCPWDWFLPAGHPFQSVGLFYWSSSGPSDPIDPAPAGYALGVDFPGGYVDADGQTFSVAVWCVRN
ncbi:MAG: DUF1566 domain-containing protein [bacterium]|nr:DUF1566 domain-containing protein [bacterium]